jgi:uncharacterized protein (TIGR02757 family)
LNKKDLKELLDNLYLKYKNKHSSKDPLWILHSFQDEEDIEIAGLITSCYAYGQVDQINKFILKFLKSIDFKVHEFTSNYSEQKDKKFLKDLYYRFNSEEDLSLLILNIQNVLKIHGSLKNLFESNFENSHDNIIPALTKFTDGLNEIQRNDIRNTNFNYLIPSPENKSTCKRLNLFLRWMIRKDEIDLGLWDEKISKSKLIMPVDTHIFRVSNKLKLVKRKSCDLKFAIELTEKLKSFDPEDPVKYDFALCHIGIEKIKDLRNI